MSVLCLAPQYNTGKKKDATGAFQPEAKAFAKLHSVDAPILIDNSKSKAAMRKAVLAAIESAEPDTLVLFCHGWKTGIQFGFGLSNVKELVAAFPDNMLAPRVILYGCLTADGGGVGGDGGFADTLRDAFCANGHEYAQVDAHVTAGHTTRNPFVRRFEGGGIVTGGVGGYYLVTPKSALWKKWVSELKGELRFLFPFMTTVDIHAYLDEV